MPRRRRSSTLPWWTGRRAGSDPPHPSRLPGRCAGIHRADLTRCTPAPGAQRTRPARHRTPRTTRIGDMATAVEPQAAPQRRSAEPRPALLQKERIPVVIVEEHDDFARIMAQRIADIIRDKAARGERAVLGLPTGSTPVEIYRELMRMHREEGLDFS